MNTIQVKPTREQVRLYVFLDELRDDEERQAEIEPVIAASESLVIRAILNKCQDILVEYDFPRDEQTWKSKGIMNDFLADASADFIGTVWQYVQEYLNEHPEELLSDA
jgi:hypothetical protein